MRIFRDIVFVLAAILLPLLPTMAQKEDLTQIWPANWIKASIGPEKDFGVFHFRHAFFLDTLPQSLQVYTSGDNRYQLYVNGHLATWGPQRGDLDHWKYETTQIAPLLRKGKNVLAVVVWNYGAYPPDAQFSVQTAFLLAAGDRTFRQLNTGPKWKATYNPAYSPIPVDKSQVNGYYGAGANERFSSAQHHWGWRDVSYNDTLWPAAVSIESAKARTCIWAGRWKLEPREIALEKMSLQRFASIRIAEGVEIPAGFPMQPGNVQIPAHARVRLVFDMGVTTTAFPVMNISGGKNALIRMKYVEAPYQTKGVTNPQKGNRNEVNGKEFLGLYDEWIPDGGGKREHQPLWWRAFRYVEVRIETVEEPLILHDYSAMYTSYPFSTRANLSLSGGQLPVTPETITRMLEVGERTIRLCSHETYMDCPYYEQTQFEGDTRVQALISYYIFGDPALAKNAIIQFDWSRNEEGFLSARYPANSTYYIPNFSLFWIGMLYDYMMHVGDKAFIQDKIHGTRAVLTYFLKRQREDGSVRRPDFHNFVDWSFPLGETPFDSLGYSALVDLHLLLALQWAEKLETFADSGDPYFRYSYQNNITRLKASILKNYYRSDKKLFADNRAPQSPFSLHTNAMAVLCGVVEGSTAKDILNRAIAEPGLTKPTIYWHFYWFEALAKAGLGNEYLLHTGVWQDMLQAGCTTWPETGLQSRSECHGWGASPNYHLYKILLGVQPAAPGFSKILIEPHPGGAENLSGTVPHPRGEIQVNLSGVGTSRFSATVTLPAATEGTFRWKGKDYPLRAGRQVIAVGK